MKLTVVTGHRELFYPLPVALDALEAVFRAVHPTAAVPRIDWAVGEGNSPYHGFVFDAPGAAERRCELLLEYLEDRHGSAEHAYLILPFESLRATAAATISDVRLRGLVDSLRGRPGLSVTTQRLILSAHTRAVLCALAEPCDDHPAAAELDVERIAGRGPAFEAMQLNYAHAVLELGEARLRSRSVFGTVGRASRVAELLAGNLMRLDADLPLQRIEAELEPGGELWALLTRPLPVAAEPRPTLAGAARTVAAAGELPALLLELPQPLS